MGLLGEVRRRTAVLLDPDRMWLSALEGVMESVGFAPIGKLTEPVRGDGADQRAPS